MRLKIESSRGWPHWPDQTPATERRRAMTRHCRYSYGPSSHMQLHMGTPRGCLPAFACVRIPVGHPAKAKRQPETTLRSHNYRAPLCPQAGSNVSGELA